MQRPEIGNLNFRIRTNFACCASKKFESAGGAKVLLFGRATGKLSISHCNSHHLGAINHTQKTTHTVRSAGASIYTLLGDHLIWTKCYSDDTAGRYAWIHSKHKKVIFFPLRGGSGGLCSLHLRHPTAPVMCAHNGRLMTCVCVHFSSGGKRFFSLIVVPRTTTSPPELCGEEFKPCLTRICQCLRMNEYNMCGSICRCSRRCLSADDV
jgi:hypothetical protein